MQTKLTLRLDDRLIEQAKAYARQSDKSLSQLVSEYFALLLATPPADEELTPAVKALKGILKDADIELDDYRKYREEKHT